LRKGDAEILAYVATTNAARDIEAVKADIKIYAENFDIDGIFFDETSGKLEDLDYYNEITRYAKSFKSVKEVMLNSPYLHKEFIQSSQADSFLIFENSYEHIDTLDIEQYSGIDFTRLHVILHSVTDSQTMKNLITQLNQQKITNLYITDKSFDKLPTFFDDEVSIIQENNSKLK
jgi:hypothetical protein